MVGPRSLGCRTCVRRKVRCDGTRPQCARCQTAGFTCLGYSHPIVFMPPATTTGESSGRIQSTRSTTSTRRAGAAPRLPDSQSSIDHKGALLLDMPGLNWPSRMTVTPSNYTDDTYCVFFLDRYFRFDNWNDDFQSNKAWFWRALQSPSQYPISNVASRALTTAFFARIHKTDRLHEDAYQLHGLALKAMVSQMQTGPISFDVLSANALLGLFEACSYSSPMAWQRHTRAMRVLYQSVGPEFFKDRPARSLLMMCRFSIISETILSRDKCFLAEDKWLNILASDDREASLTVKLGDIVVHAPAIFEGINTINLFHLSGNNEATTLAQALFSRLINHLQDLKKWWAQWSADSRRLPFKVDFSSDTDDTMAAPPLSQGLVSQFCNLEAAAGWCRYHAHVVIALRWMRRLLDLNISNTIPSEIFDQDPDGSITQDTTKFRVSEQQVQSHALAVCEGLHFYSLPRYRHVGAVYMGLPARIAWQSLPEGSPHGLWIEQLMDFMATHSGFTISRCILRDMKADD